MRKRTQEAHQQQEGSLQSLLAEPLDPRQTRQILEIRFPILFYMLIDQHNRYRLIGRPGLPGGHFQVGTFNARDKEWMPAPNQDGLVWESKQERDCILHRIHRRQNVEVAFIQHAPTYTKLHGIQVLQSVNLVEVTSLWGDPKMVGLTLTCGLIAQCGCETYQSLLQARNFQWMD